MGISNVQTNGNQTATTKRGQWVDKNNDGICDNYQNLKTNPKGSNFVDKNKDGICDNYQNNAKNNMCCGQGMQCRKGNGNGWENH